MNWSVLSPEILVCEEFDWSNEKFQIKFTQQLLNIVSLFEKNKNKTKLAITTELLALLWVNSPWNKDCWTKPFFSSKNYAEIYGDLQRISNCYDDQGQICKISPNIFFVGGQDIYENLINLLHILLDKSADRSILLGFNNKNTCDIIDIICECHNNQKYDIFTIDTYDTQLQQVSTFSYRLTPEEKSDIKIVFRNWRIKPDTKQNELLQKYNLLFKHCESGYGRIYSPKHINKFRRVACTPSASNAGKNIALDLIKLIEAINID